VTDDGLGELRDAVDAAAAEVPEYLRLPIAERTFQLTPPDLAAPRGLRCTSRGRVVGMMSDGVAAVPLQREIRCDLRPGHEGSHLLFIGTAGDSGLSYIYEWSTAADDPTF
jgi:hypothetical protein